MTPRTSRCLGLSRVSSYMGYAINLSEQMSSIETARIGIETKSLANRPKRFPSRLRNTPSRSCRNA